MQLNFFTKTKFKQLYNDVKLIKISLKEVVQYIYYVRVPANGYKYDGKPVGTI